MENIDKNSKNKMQKHKARKMSILNFHHDLQVNSQNSKNENSHKLQNVDN